MIYYQIIRLKCVRYVKNGSLKEVIIVKYVKNVYLNWTIIVNLLIIVLEPQIKDILLPDYFMELLLRYLRQCICYYLL